MLAQSLPEQAVNKVKKKKSKIKMKNSPRVVIHLILSALSIYHLYFDRYSKANQL